MIDVNEALYRAARNDACLGRMDAYLDEVRAVYPNKNYITYCLHRYCTEATATGPGGWDEYAAANSINPEVAYIHHGGSQIQHRRQDPTAQNWYVMNMGSAQYLAWRRQRTINALLGTEFGPPAHSTGPMNGIVYDLVLWYPAFDTTGNTDILNSVEYGAGPDLDYQDDCVADFIATKAAIDASAAAGSIVYPNFGALSDVVAGDANTLAIIAAADGVFGEVALRYGETGGVGKLEIPNATDALTRWTWIDTHCGTNDKELFLHGYIEDDDEQAENDQAKIGTAAFFLLCDQDNLHARFVLDFTEPAPHIQNWEQNDLMVLAKKRLGSPTSARTEVGSWTQGRLFKRTFQNGEVYLYVQKLGQSGNDTATVTLTEDKYPLDASGDPGFGVTGLSLAIGDGAILWNGGSVPPIVVEQIGQFKITDYYYARSSVIGLPSIAAGVLPAGTKWWVTVTGTLAGEYNGVVVPGQLEASIIQGYPSYKTYGYVRCRSNLHGTPESNRAGHLNTSFILTSDGSMLEFLFYTVDGTFDGYLSGFKIIAYPLADMTEGVDYFYENTVGDGSDVGSPVLTTTSGGYQTILSKTYTIQAPGGPYLVMANCGMNCIQSQSAKIDLLQNGVEIGVEWIKKMHPTVPSTDRAMAQFIEVRTLSAGQVTFHLRGASNTGGNDKKFYQPRIVLIRLAYFQQYLLQQGIGGTINTNYPAWKAISQLTLVPTNSFDYALVLGNTTHYPSVQGFVSNRIRNLTAATILDDGQAEANYFDPNIDRATIGTAGCELCTGPTTYIFEATGEAAIGNTTMTHGTFLVIQLTPNLGAQPINYAFTEVIDIAESVEGLNPAMSRSDVLGISDSLAMTVSGGPVAIPNTHPRLWLSADRLAYLQTQTGSSFWTDMINNDLGDSAYTYWMRALAWKVTGDVTHLNWIKSNIDLICEYHLGTYESGGLTAGRWIRSAAMVYDWCYSDLTAAEKLKFQDYLLGTLYAILNDNPNPPFENIYNQDWSRNDPSNNYFSGMMQATVYVALVLYHDVFPTNPAPTFSWPPGTGQNTREWIMPLYKPAHGTPAQPPFFRDGWEYCKARMEQLVVGFWDRKSSGGLVGGSWHEGSWYKPMWANYECLRLMQDVAGYTAPFTNLDNKDFIWYCLHAPMPGSTRPPELGDSGAADVRKSVSSSDRTLMLMLADKYRNEPEGQYAQWWLQNVVTATESGDHQWDGNDALFYDTRITAIDYRPIIGKSWFAESSGLVMSRTGWTNTDTAVMLHAQDRIQLHEHGEQNSIQIACGRAGTSDSQFMVGPRCAHGSSGENQFSDWKAEQHSTYTLAGVPQRASKTSFYPNDTQPTGNIPRYSPHNGTYTYGQGDASDAYRIGTANYYETINPNKKAVDVFLRDVVHLTTPNLVVVYDHIKLRATTPDGTSVPQTAKSHLHMPGTPTLASGIVTVSAGTARVFYKPVLPVSPTITLDNENDEGMAFGCYDVQTDLTVTSNYARHLMVFDVTDTSQGSMITTTAITSSDFYEGVTMDDGGVRYHVVFATSQTGAAPAAGFYYDVTKSANTDRHIIANLDLNGPTYAITETAQGGGVYRYSFTKGGAGPQVDVGGTLTFTPALLTAGPTVTITETAVTVGADTIPFMLDTVVIQDSGVTAGPDFFQNIFDSQNIQEAAIVVGPDVLTFNVEAEVEINETAIAIGADTLTLTDIVDITEAGFTVNPDILVPIVETMESTETTITVGPDVIASIIGAESAEITETAITVGPDTFTTDESIFITEAMQPTGPDTLWFFEQPAPFQETAIVIGEQLSVSTVVAPLISALTIGTGATVSVTDIPPPIVPGTEAPGTKIDMEVTFTGETEIDTEVDF